MCGKDLYRSPGQIIIKPVLTDQYESLHKNFDEILIQVLWAQKCPKVKSLKSLLNMIEPD